MKVGDRVKLKSLEDIKEEKKTHPDCTGIMVEGLFINGLMIPMFGEKWEVTEICESNTWDFKLKQNDTSEWFFKFDWIEKGYDVPKLSWSDRLKDAMARFGIWLHEKW